MIKSRVLGYRINSRRGIWSEQEYRLDHYSKVSQFFRLVELFDNQNQSIKILRDVRGVRAVVTSRLSTWWKDSSSKTTCKQNWVRCEHEDPRVWPQITRENYLRSVTRSTFSNSPRWESFAIRRTLPLATDPWRKIRRASFEENTRSSWHSYTVWSTTSSLDHGLAAFSIVPLWYSRT